MIRNYSILSTNRDLSTSPYVKKLKKDHDIILTVNEPQVVNFLFQFPISNADVGSLHVVYDKEILDIDELSVECFKYQTIVSTTLTTKEVGSHEVSFSIPHHYSAAKSWLYADKRKTR